MTLLSGSLPVALNKRVAAIPFFTRQWQSPTQTAVILFAVAVMLANAPPAAAEGLAPLPLELIARDRDETYRLTYTGRAQRIFLFFKVYEIAHYAAVADAGDMALMPPLSLDTVITHEHAKALLIRFNRTLGRDRIRDEFAKSLRLNAQEDWLVEAQSSIDAFMAAIDRDARAGDELIFYRMPQGRLRVEFNDEEAFVTKDEAFAKLIWSIWFGAKPVCDPTELLAQLVSQEVLHEP